MTVSNVMEAPKRRRGQPRKLENCQTWLRGKLSSGSVWVDEIEASAKVDKDGNSLPYADQYSLRLLKIAKQRLSFRHKFCFDADKRGRTYWYDPAVAEPETKAAPQLPAGVIAVDQVGEAVRLAMTEQKKEAVEVAKRAKKFQADQKDLNELAQYCFQHKQTREFALAQVREIWEKNPTYPEPLDEDAVYVAVNMYYGWPQSEPIDFEKQPDKFLAVASADDLANAIYFLCGHIVPDDVYQFMPPELKQKADESKRLLDKVVQRAWVVNGVADILKRLLQDDENSLSTKDPTERDMMGDRITQLKTVLQAIR